MRAIRTFPAKRENVEEMKQYTQDLCVMKKMSHREISQVLLILDEVLALRLEQEEEGEVKIQLQNHFGSLTLRISMKGDEWNPLYAEQDEFEDDYSHRILSIYKDKLTYLYKNRSNILLISLKQSEQKLMYLTLIALAISLFVGFVLNAMGITQVNQTLDTNLFKPVQTMFLNALKMIVVPVVFFSIVCCISNLKDLSSLGKIAGKTLGLYILTTMIAIGVAMGVFFLFQPGQSSSVDLSTVSYATKTAKVSIVDTIVNIVPSNLIDPIQKMDMLQVLFIALLSGVAVGMIGEHSQILQNIFNACNELFLKITILIMKTTPIAVFCMMTSLVMNTGKDTLLSLLSMTGVYIVGLLGMIVVYSLLLLFFGKQNPFPFLKKLFPYLLTPFTLGSSNATMPMTLDFCSKKLHLPQKVTTFAIPLGSTINMDGSSIYIVVGTLFLANLCHIQITPEMLTTVAISTLILSVGAPGVPGAGLVCLSMLVVQVGIPASAVGIVVGLDRLYGMLRTASNVAGDIVVSAIVSRGEED